MIRLDRCGCARLIRAIDRYIEKADEDTEDALRAAGFAAARRTVKDMAELEESLRKILEADMSSTITTINDCEDIREFLNEAWPEIQNDGSLVEKLTRTFSSKFTEVIPDYAAEYLKRVEADVGLESVSLLGKTTEWIQSWSGELARLMKLSDNRAIQSVLDKGLRDGKGVQEVAQAIADNGLRAPGYRARRVATTELLRAHSVAQQESFLHSPAVTGKMWKHSGWRTYARKNHMKSAASGGVNGQIVKKEQAFTLAGEDGVLYYPMYPRDSSLPPGESVNCGCVCQPVVDEDILGMSLEERNRLRDEALAELDPDFDRKLDEQNARLAFGLRDAQEWKDERVTGIFSDAVTFPNDEHGDRERRLRYGTEAEFERDRGQVKARPVLNFKENYLHLDTRLSMRRSELNRINQNITEAKKIMGISDQCSIPIVITESSNSIASYNPRTDILFINPKFGTTGDIMRLQDGYTCPDNEISSAVHELYHWQDANEYRNRGGIINDSKSFAKYIAERREQSEIALAAYGIDTADADWIQKNISEYARKKIVLENDYDEAYTEYRTKLLLEV